MLKLLPKKIVNKKFYRFGLGLILLLLFISIYFYYKPHNLVVDFFDIGQGDSALIITPNNKTILIDGGPDNTVLRRLGDVLPFYQRRIDLIIFSHYHADHITGLISVIKRYQVKEIIYAPSNFSSPILETLLATLKKRKVKTLLINSKAQLNFSPSCFLAFLNVNSLGIKPAQNNSLTVKLNCHNKRFLFTGDNSSVVERALINSGWDLKAEVLKDPHHGSKTANSENFLRAVNPDLVLISVGLNNKFKLPNLSVLERLNILGIPFWRTDKLGSLKIIIP